MNMKPKIMWAIVDRKTLRLGYGTVNFVPRPLLYERREFAVSAVGKSGRVAKVEIREIGP